MRKARRKTNVNQYSLNTKCWESKSHADLLKVLNYDKETGSFKWLIYRNYKVGRGSFAGNEPTIVAPYIKILIDGMPHKAHRLAWFFVYGEWPKGQIDHINGNKGDNRICNLRDVSKQTNSENMRRARADSKTGMQGVQVWHHKWRARITINGKKRHLGLFKTADEAHAVYVAAKRSLHAGCTL